ncbi:MORN repeat-containing protein [Baaleninema sp.]|uniref:MORN repeat-containing protein n=1 Tax=Baaleninema sp. TaxID=3101197 RepID=UPI003D0215E3
MLNIVRTVAAGLSGISAIAVTFSAYAQEDVRNPQCLPESILETGSGYGRCNYGPGISYIGTYSNYLPNGRGIYTLSDGTRYEGEFVDGTPEGQGRLILPNDARYEGMFRNGAIRQGVAFYPNGDRYEGEFGITSRTEIVTENVVVSLSVNGRPLLEPRETTRRFDSSQPDGEGSYSFSNGNRFVGEFFAGQPFGRGTFYHSTGTVCEGYFYTRNFDAENATCNYTDGRRYVGELRQARPHGTGTMTLADGTVISGAFRAGQPVSFSGYQ